MWILASARFMNDALISRYVSGLSVDSVVECFWPCGCLCVCEAVFKNEIYDRSASCTPPTTDWQPLSERETHWLSKTWYTPRESETERDRQDRTGNGTPENKKELPDVGWTSEMIEIRVRLWLFVNGYFGESSWASFNTQWHRLLRETPSSVTLLSIGFFNVWRCTEYCFAVKTSRASLHLNSITQAFSQCFWVQ